WTWVGTFPGGKRFGAGGFVAGGKGYVVSGDHFANNNNTFGQNTWQYNAGSNTWVQKADFPGAGRTDATAESGTIDGTNVGLYAGGGNLTTAFGDAWEYVPSTDSWSQLSNIPGGPRMYSGSFVVGRTLFITNLTVVTFNWSK